MITWKSVLSLVTSVAIAAAPFRSYAQTVPIEALQASVRQQQSAVAELNAAISELRAQNLLLSSMIKTVLANQQASQNLATLRENPDLARQNAEHRQAPAKEAADLVAKIPDSSIPPELREGIKKCISNTYSISVTTLEAKGKDPKALLDACPEARQLIEQLQKQKHKAIEAWNECKAVLVNAKVINPSSLPESPSGLTASGTADISKRLSEIEALVKQTTGDLQNCAKKLKDVKEQISDQDKAAAALGATFAFAAQVCASSGGNPYVCGALFVIAALMSLFNDGGGKGDGDGPKQGSGPGDVDIADSVPGKTPDLGPVSTAGNFGRDKAGKVACNREGSTLTCWLRAMPQRRVIINPAIAIQDNSPVASELAGLIVRGEDEKLELCSQDADPFVRGLLLLSPPTYRIIELRVAGGALRVNYPPAADRPQINNLTVADLCAKSFRVQ